MKFVATLFVLLLAACATKPAKVLEPEIKPVDEKWLQDNAALHNHDVMLCYQKRLKTKPGLQGELRLEFDVTSAGEIKGTKIAKSVDPEIDKCVFEAAKEWKFPWNVRGEMDDVPMADTFKLTIENGQPSSNFIESQTGMDKEQIRRAIREHLGEIRQCFDNRRREDPNVHGRLVLEWDVWSNGFAHDIRAKKPLDPKLDSCIIDKMKTWQFPLPPKGMVGRVSYPFVFDIN